jgi:hypothetical protein
VSLNGAETPHETLGSAKNDAKNRSALENTASKVRNCLLHTIFQQPASGLAATEGNAQQEGSQKYAGETQSLL